MMGLGLRQVALNDGDRIANLEEDYVARVNRVAVKKNLPKAIKGILGCGGFGCVWRTTDDNIVVKVTMDKDEVSFARMLMEDPTTPPGFVKYLAVVPARDSTFLWRESADLVGQPPTNLKDLLEYYRPYAREAKSVVPTPGEHGHGVWKKHVAMAAKLLEKVKVELPASPSDPDRPHIIVDGKDVKLQQWWPHEEERFTNEWVVNHFTSMTHAMRFVVSWKAAKLGAKKLQQVPELSLLGDAALWALDKGIVLSDLRADNIGLVERDGQPRWVIIDPGWTLSAKKSVPPGSRKLLENPVRGPQAWKMTLKEFLGDSKIVKMGQAAQLRPRMTRGAKSAPAEPFMQGLHIHRDRDDGSGYFHDVVTDEQDKEPVATYDGRNLIVAKPYRRRGIGLELVVDFRTRHPGIPAAETRNKASQALQKKAHRVIVERALKAGMPVADHVLKDYPDLQRRNRNPASAVETEGRNPSVSSVDWFSNDEVVWLGGKWPPSEDVWTPMDRHVVVPEDVWRDGTLSFNLIGVLRQTKNIGIPFRGQVLIRLDGGIERAVTNHFAAHPQDLEAARSFWMEHADELKRRRSHFHEDYYLRAGGWKGASRVRLDADSPESHGYDRVTERRYEQGVSVLRLTPRLGNAWNVVTPDPREALYHTGQGYLTDFFTRFAKGRSLFLVQGERIQDAYGADGEPLLDPSTVKERGEMTIDQIYVGNTRVDELGVTGGRAHQNPVNAISQFHRFTTSGPVKGKHKAVAWVVQLGPKEWMVQLGVGGEWILQIGSIVKDGGGLRTLQAVAYAIEQIIPFEQWDVEAQRYLGSWSLRPDAEGNPVSRIHPLSLDAWHRKVNPAAAMKRKVITSAATSRPQVPALFKALVESGQLQPGARVLDVGAGKYNLGRAYMQDHGIEAVPYDPWNRSMEENNAALKVAEKGSTDACLCANVLNVIPYQDDRDHVIWLCANAVKKSGKSAWFQVYEGDMKGKGKMSGPDSWQENRKTVTYLPEIRKYFKNVEAKRVAGRTVIEASGPKVDQ